MKRIVNSMSNKLLFGIIFGVLLVIGGIVGLAVGLSKSKPTPTTPPPTSTTNAPKPSKLPFDPTKLSNEEKSRIDCYFEAESQYEKLTKYSCESRGCIYQPSAYEKVPDCFFNNTNLGYNIDGNFDPKDKEFTLKRSSGKTPFLGEIDQLKLTVSYLGENFINVKITDKNKERYEIPYGLNKPSELADKSKSSAEFELVQDPITKLISFKIIRKSNKRVLFDTSFAGFIFSDQFIQISTKLPSENVFGFGENNHESLRHDLNFKSWGVFARDNAPGWGVCHFLLFKSKPKNFKLLH